MSRHHFAQLAKTAQEVAKKWPNSRPAIRRQDEEFSRYNMANSKLLYDIQCKNPLIGREMVREPMPHGMRLMFRYCHIASLVARQDEASVEELVGVLRNPASFGTLETLLGQSKHLAFRTETALGIIPGYQPVDAAHQDKWAIEDGVFRAPSLDQITEVEQQLLDSEYFTVPDGVCLAHRAKVVEPLFQAVVAICERDEDLFARSLAKEKSSKRSSVSMHLVI